MPDQQFCLRWNNHQNTLVSVFDSLLEGEILVDCTLAAEGKFLRAHKVVISACSPFFSDLLRQHYEKHPILIMKDVKFEHLKAMLDYMYRGEVNISQDELGAFLNAAESLQIKGLSDSASNFTAQSKKKLTTETKSSEEEPSSSRSSNICPPPHGRKRRHPSGGHEESPGEDTTNELLTDTNSQLSPSVSQNLGLSSPPSPSLSLRNESSPDGSSRQPSARHLLNTNSLPFGKSDRGQQQSPSPLHRVLQEPKTEFIEVDEENNMHEEDMRGAGPSHSKVDDGFNWHIDQPEESFLQPESHSSHSSALGSLHHARFKLAHALKDLTATLQKNLGGNSSRIMEALASNIDCAVGRLGKLAPTNPFYFGKNNGSFTIVNGRVKSLESKIKRPGPKCHKSLQRKRHKLNHIPKIPLLDVGESNKIWLVPKIELIDVVKNKSIKSEQVDIETPEMSV